MSWKPSAPAAAPATPSRACSCISAFCCRRASHSAAGPSHRYAPQLDSGHQRLRPSPHPSGMGPGAGDWLGGPARLAQGGQWRAACIGTKMAEWVSEREGYFEQGKPVEGAPPGVTRSPRVDAEDYLADDFDDEELFEEVTMPLNEAVQEYINGCQAEFGIDDLLEVVPGPNSCPAVNLYHPSGYAAQINMLGANTTNFLRPDGADILSGRPGLLERPLQPIQGGTMLVFPQLGRASGVAGRAGLTDTAAVPADGFLNKLHWTLVHTAIADPACGARDPAPTATFLAQDTAWTRAQWPHCFEAMVTISLMYTDKFFEEGEGIAMPIPTPPPSEEDSEDEDTAEEPASEGDDTELAIAPEAAMEPELEPELEPVAAPAPSLTPWRTPKTNVKANLAALVDAGAPAPPEPTPVQLRTVLQIANRDETPFTFLAGIQSHVAVLRYQDAEVRGLRGKMCLDSDANATEPRLRMEDADPLPLPGSRMDRVYIDAALESAKDELIVHPGNWRFRLQPINRGGARDVALQAPSPAGAQRAGRETFLALSAGALARPVTLQPGEVWSSEVVLRVFDQEHFWPPEEDLAEGYEDLMAPMRPPVQRSPWS